MVTFSKVYLMLKMSQKIPTSSVPSAPTPPYIRVSPLQAVRDTSEPWSLSLPGVAQNRTWSEPPGRETKGPTLGGEVPHGLPSTLTQGPRGPPSILTGSLSVAPSFFSCGKKTPCETPRRRKGHQVLKEALVLGPREVSRTVATDPPRAGWET